MSGEAVQLDGAIPATSWSLISRAASEEVRGDRAAMGELLVRYLPALRIHVRHRLQLDAHQAEDLLQSFIADKIIERNILARADRSRGRFRTFLLSALDRYASNLHRNEHAAKRHPGRLVSLDAPGAESLEPAEPAGGRSFEVAWARQVLDETLRRMRQQCLRAERVDLWGVFDLRLRAPIMEGIRKASYEELVGRFGFASPVQASNALITARRMFCRVLREVVAEYAGDVQEVEEEIADLAGIVSAGAES